MGVQGANQLGVVAMNDTVQLNRFVYARCFLRRVIFNNVAAKVQREDVAGPQSSKRWPKAIHQHAVRSDHHADMSGIGRAESGTIETARRTADVELEPIEIQQSLHCAAIVFPALTIRGIVTQ